MTDIAEALWLFLPAAIANATPVAANYVPGLKKWKTPVDFGKSYRGQRLLGDNKSWRGVVCGIAAGALTGYLQSQLTPGTLSPFVQTLFAISISLGALYGDAVESFIKRQLGVSPGHSWFPFDQLDYILGGLIAAAPYAIFSLTGMGAIVVFYFVAHLLTVYIFHHLGVRERPI